MVSLGALAFVVLAGLVTCLATGFGALPFFLVDEIPDRWTVGLWGFASGIMLSASGFGLILQGLDYGTVSEVGLGAFAGVVLVVLAHDVVMDAEIDPEEFATADFRKLVLILGVLTVHSFPEGVAVGVSFANLGLESAENTLVVLGFSMPVLAVFMTVAISIHNVPEGLAVSIPLKNLGMSKWRMVGAAVFSSLPQPIGAGIAFVFVRWARVFLPYGFGFAAGAMTYLVLTEFVPEALDTGRDLEHRGLPAFALGLLGGALAMTPLLLY